MSYGNFKFFFQINIKHFLYSDALKNSFFPQTISKWNSFSTSDKYPRRKRSLGYSSFSQKDSRNIVYFSSRNSKLTLSGVMIVFDRVRFQRRKERNNRSKIHYNIFHK